MQLQLRGVSKSFGAFRLHPIDLTIERGEFFCLLGPSGCGKTTILRLIGGFETPDTGQILLNQNDVTKMPPHKRNFHTVFQRYALFPHLTVFDNVAFSLKLRKLPKKQIESRVNECLSLVQIQELSHRKIQSLSGGQSQRVALARALANKPEVLLLDEPLSALDPELRIKMREELKSLCKKLGMTFIMVTHDQEEALQLSDRLAVLRNGQVFQIGTPKAIYEDPVDSFVARFIGPANEISGELATQEGDQLLLQSSLGQFKVKRSENNLSKNISVVLRPEKMRILRQRSAIQENLIDGDITELTYLGSRTEYTVRVKGQIFKVFEQELERQKKRQLNVGDHIYLTWRTEDLIILNSNSGGSC